MDAAAFFFIGLSMQGGEDETRANPRKYKALQGFAKTQRAREVWFCVMSGGAVLKIATVEIARIIH